MTTNGDAHKELKAAISDLKISQKMIKAERKAVLKDAEMYHAQAVADLALLELHENPALLAQFTKLADQSDIPRDFAKQVSRNLTTSQKSLKAFEQARIDFGSEQEQLDQLERADETLEALKQDARAKRVQKSAASNAVRQIEDFKSKYWQEDSHISAETMDKLADAGVLSRMFNADIAASHNEIRSYAAEALKQDAEALQKIGLNADDVDGYVKAGRWQRFISRSTRAARAGIMDYSRKKLQADFKAVDVAEEKKQQALKAVERQESVVSIQKRGLQSWLNLRDHADQAQQLGARIADKLVSLLVVNEAFFQEVSKNMQQPEVFRALQASYKAEKLNQLAHSFDGQLKVIKDGIESLSAPLDKLDRYSHRSFRSPEKLNDVKAFRQGMVASSSYNALSSRQTREAVKQYRADDFAIWNMNHLMMLMLLTESDVDTAYTATVFDPNPEITAAAGIDLEQLKPDFETVLKDIGSADFGDIDLSELNIDLTNLDMNDLTQLDIGNISTGSFNVSVDISVTDVGGGGGTYSSPTSDF